MNFVDQIHITVQAGRGGSGCESYHRRMDRKSVPNGGDGGQGGSVYFVADREAHGLSVFRGKKKLAAEIGENGGSTKKRGKNGADLYIKVPVGAIIRDETRQLLIRELLQPGDQVLVAKGGSGGFGNHKGRPSTPGEPGETLQIELSVKLKADVFLVGLPNSGKSRLLNTLTRTRLKEEAHPFTTRSPELGVWESENGPLTLCELPSLYQSSHEGRGAGADFLKHLEGAGHLLFVLDPVSQFAPTLTEGLEILRNQLGRYSEGFLEIPAAAVVTKMDLEEAKQIVKKQKFKPSIPVFFVSAESGEKMKDLLKWLSKIQKETASS